MIQRHSDGQELGELVSTAHNTYTNAGSVAQCLSCAGSLSKFSASELSSTTPVGVFNDEGTLMSVSDPV